MLPFRTGQRQQKSPKCQSQLVTLVVLGPRRSWGQTGEDRSLQVERPLDVPGRHSENVPEVTEIRRQPSMECLKVVARGRQF